MSEITICLKAKDWLYKVRSPDEVIGNAAHSKAFPSNWRYHLKGWLFKELVLFVVKVDTVGSTAVTARQSH